MLDDRLDRLPGSKKKAAAKSFGKRNQAPLQRHLENEIISLIRAANGIAKNDGRVTFMPKDLKLAREIRSG